MKEPYISDRLKLLAWLNAASRRERWYGVRMIHRPDGISMLFVRHRATKCGHWYAYPLDGIPGISWRRPGTVQRRKA